VRQHKADVVLCPFGAESRGFGMWNAEDGSQELKRLPPVCDLAPEMTWVIPQGARSSQSLVATGSGAECMPPGRKSLVDSRIGRRSPPVRDQVAGRSAHTESVFPNL
jgi:hypothetical protein